tara:strand:+ start:62 stop:436 length:375 start_codon:yes stop_codon:yes gene_type:complete
MALITTTKTIGWYGVHGESECESLSLPDLIGTYKNGAFQVGSSGLSESQAIRIQIWTMTPDGAPWGWDIRMEKDFRENVPSLLAPLEALECGQMYWINKSGNDDINLPGYVPTAHGVDMGRVSV